MYQFIQAARMQIQNGHKLKNARNGEKESKLNEIRGNYCTRSGLRHKTIKMILFKWYSVYKTIQKRNPISFQKISNLNKQSKESNLDQIKLKKSESGNAGDICRHTS